MEDQHFEDQEGQQPFFDFLTQICHQRICLYARQLEEYSNEAHLSTVIVAIQYSEKIHDTDEFPLMLKAKMIIVILYSGTIQRPPSS